MHMNGLRGVNGDLVKLDLHTSITLIGIHQSLYGGEAAAVYTSAALPTQSVSNPLHKVGKHLKEA